MKKGKQIGFILLASLMMLALLYTCNKKDRPRDREEDTVEQNDTANPINKTESTSVELEPEKEIIPEVQEKVALVEEFKKGNKQKGYYVAPIDGPILLSGTFGELRNNHFHAGLDIRTGGVQGKSVKAAASGYISRIKVSAGGYGKALYIQHPNGTTTVYGHLKM
ncbi:MAG: murein DD-endopeptidase MepM/ murein hydrolase activator NlpD, partial [Bacteroidia bacterium]